jgi:hypothetical protein
MALPGGEAIWAAAKELGIDDEKPLVRNGVRSGSFVGRITPIVESLNARAIPLDDDLPHIVVGALVSFDGAMRSRNTLLPSELSSLDATWDRVPRLEFGAGRYRVMVRYDPRWLTTNTAFVDLKQAEKEEAVYSGLGVVVGITDEVIRISALVFGKPMSNEAAAFEHAMYVFQQEGMFGISTRISTSRGPRSGSQIRLAAPMWFDRIMLAGRPR